MLPISPSQLNADIASVIGTCIVLKILPSPSIIRRERTPFRRALQTASFQTLGLSEHRIPQNLMIDHHFPNHISIFRGVTGAEATFLASKGSIKRIATGSQSVDITTERWEVWHPWKKKVKSFGVIRRWAWNSLDQWHSCDAWFVSTVDRLW